LRKSPNPRKQEGSVNPYRKDQMKTLGLVTASLLLVVSANAAAPVKPATAAKTKPARHANACASNADCDTITGYWCIAGQCQFVGNGGGGVTKK
jgi:hypothetical protein